MRPFDYQEHFRSQLDVLKHEKRYRVFRDLSRHCGDFPHATIHQGDAERNVTIWCSNDYLGMGQHPKVLAAMHEAVERYGAGAGGTRNISGTHHPIVELEAEIAALYHKEAALVFSSGYIANDTALSTLGAMLPECVIFSDADNHASMIAGIRHSGCEKKLFRHSDPEHLDELLRSVPGAVPKLVVFESLYSMGGDFAPLHELIAVAKRHGALIYVDEIHAVALYGDHGAGVIEQEGLLGSVDIIQGGLGKGFGVVGGFIAGSATMVDAVRSCGAGFIFTTALPPVIAAGGLASIRHLKSSSVERRALFERVHKVRTVLSAAQLPVRETTSQIVPLMVGDADRCKRISDMLLEEFNIYIQPINYPTVPRGTERLRITPSPLHTDEMTSELVRALSTCWKKMK